MFFINFYTLLNNISFIFLYFFIKYSDFRLGGKHVYLDSKLTKMYYLEVKEQKMLKITGKKSLSSFLKKITDISILFILLILFFYLLTSIIHPVSKKVNLFNKVKIIVSPPKITSFVMMDVREIKTIVSIQGGKYKPSPDKIFHFKKRERIFNVVNTFLLIFLLLLALFILFQLRGIFKNLTEDKFYSPDNPKKFLKIGLFIIFIGIVKNALLFINETIIIEYIRLYNHSYTISLNFDFTIIFMGLLFIVLAEVFKYGVKLKEENDLTI